MQQTTVSESLNDTIKQRSPVSSAQQGGMDHLTTIKILKWVLKILCGLTPFLVLRVPSSKKQRSACFKGCKELTVYSIKYGTLEEY